MDSAQQLISCPIATLETSSPLSTSLKEKGPGIPLAGPRLTAGFILPQIKRRGKNMESWQRIGETDLKAREDDQGMVTNGHRMQGNPRW
jgi:hypothetical protein